MHGTFRDIKNHYPFEVEDLAYNPARGIVIALAIMLPIYAAGALIVFLLR
jgi:hypothetical protein